MRQDLEEPVRNVMLTDQSGQALEIMDRLDRLVSLQKEQLRVLLRLLGKNVLEDEA